MTLILLLPLGYFARFKATHWNLGQLGGIRPPHQEIGVFRASLNSYLNIYVAHQSSQRQSRDFRVIWGIERVRGLSAPSPPLGTNARAPSYGSSVSVKLSPHLSSTDCYIRIPPIALWASLQKACWYSSSSPILSPPSIPPSTHPHRPACALHSLSSKNPASRPLIHH